MLTTETIKKAAQFADGFEYLEDNGFQKLKLGKWVMVDYVDGEPVLWNIDAYDLFLDRVIQGVIYKKDLYLQHGKDFIFIMIGYDFDNSQKFEHDGSTTGIRTAREQAIEWVLERI